MGNRELHENLIIGLADDITKKIVLYRTIFFYVGVQQEMSDVWEQPLLRSCNLINQPKLVYGMLFVLRT